MIVKVHKLSGKVAVVLYKDKHDVYQAVIIDRKDLVSERRDIFIEVSDDVMEKSTPYGIDWNIVFPDGIVIDPGTVQNYMYEHGVVAPEDLRSNNTIFRDMLQTYVRSMFANLYNKVMKVIMEDYHDIL